MKDQPQHRSAEVARPGGRQLSEEEVRGASGDVRPTILTERAQLLAKPSESGGGTEVDRQVITFELSGEHYAVEIRYVRKIVPFTKLAHVPGAPSFLLGVVNLHGEMLPVFDLREVLGIQRRTISDLVRILVLGDEHAEFGILADATDQVRGLSADELLEAPGGESEEWVMGLTRDALVVLDGASLLTNSRFFVNQNGK